MNELPGFIPATSYYDRYYGKNRWKALTVISMAIGQGEIGTTPLQLANMTAAIANRGYYYTPHIVKSVGHSGSIDPRFTQKHIIDIDSANFEEIILGMEAAVNGGAGKTAGLQLLKILLYAEKQELHRIRMVRNTPFLLLLHLRMIRKSQLWSLLKMQVLEQLMLLLLPAL